MRASSPGAGVPAVRRVEMVGAQGLLLLDYLGQAERETFYGRQSGQRYVAGTERPIVLIDARDTDSMLAMVDDHGKSLFTVHSIEVPVDNRIDNPVGDSGSVPTGTAGNDGGRAAGSVQPDAGMVRKTRRQKRGVEVAG